MFSLICAWTNSWANNVDAGDLRRQRAHYDFDFDVNRAEESIILYVAQLGLNLRAFYTTLV